MTTFISYSRDNSAFVVRLAKDLKTAGFDVWLDQLDIPKGARWDDEIEAAVEKSSTFMIVLAPQSIESQNVKDELSYAIDSGKHILPVIIQPCKLPLRIRRFQHVDFTDQPYKESLAEIKRLLSDTQRIPRGTGEPGDPKAIPAAFKTAAGLKVPPMEKPKPAGKIRAGKVAMPAAILVVLGIAVTAVIMSIRGAKTPSAPQATDIPTVTVAAPTPTQPAPATLPATAAQSGEFYTEEFDRGVFDWSQKMIKGIDKQVNSFPSNGSLVIQLASYQKEEPYILFVNKDFTYKSVQVEAKVTNNGINDNGAVLACQIGENGWYAFEISNGGTYSIKAFDTTGRFKDGYKQIKNGGSLAIHNGKVTNTYRAVCDGNDLTLIVNGESVASVDATKFNISLPEGYIGIGADSPSKAAVEIQFDSVKVSEP